MKLEAAKTPKQMWVFLDEINTCDHLGLIAELICHRSYLGKPLPENLIILAACNPYLFVWQCFCNVRFDLYTYKRRTHAPKTAGLEGKLELKNRESRDELSTLVYRFV